MIVEHLLWRHKAVDATFFRDIRQVPPGHSMSFTASGADIQRYWFPPKVDKINIDGRRAP